MGAAAHRALAPPFVEVTHDNPFLSDALSAPPAVVAGAPTSLPMVVHAPVLSSQVPQAAPVPAIVVTPAEAAPAMLAPAGTPYVAPAIGVPRPPGPAHPVATSHSQPPVFPPGGVSPLQAHLQDPLLAPDYPALPAASLPCVVLPPFSYVVL